MPVIILTVRSDDADVLRGMEAGADDYTIKPFNYLTLLARVKAVLRRVENQPISISHDTVISSRLRIDFVSQRVMVDNELVRLNPLEYRPIVLLAKNKNAVVPYRQIVEEVWQTPFVGETENIRIYVRRVRSKLHDSPPRMILNQHGLGYVLRG